MEKIIKIIGSIGYDATEEYFREQLEATTEPTVRLLINSGGGSVFAGKGIIDAMKSSSKYFTAQVTGLAASMASAIACAADRVEVSEQAVLMIHLASMSGVSGNEQQMKKAIKVLQGIDIQLCKIYALKTGKSEAEIHKLLKAESWYFGKEILDNGFADALIDEDEPTDKATALMLAREKFAACYHAPTVQEIAAYAGEDTRDISIVSLTAEDKAAAAMMGMTPQDYAKYKPDGGGGVSSLEARHYRNQFK